MTPFKLSYYFKGKYNELYFPSETKLIKAYYVYKKIPGISFLRKEVDYSD